MQVFSLVRQRIYLLGVGDCTITSGYLHLVCSGYLHVVCPGLVAVGLGAGAVLLGNYWGGNMGGYRGAGEGKHYVLRITPVSLTMGTVVFDAFQRFSC